MISPKLYTEKNFYYWVKSFFCLLAVSTFSALFCQNWGGQVPTPFPATLGLTPMAGGLDISISSLPYTPVDVLLLGKTSQSVKDFLFLT